MTLLSINVIALFIDSQSDNVYKLIQLLTDLIPMLYYSGRFFYDK